MRERIAGIAALGAALVMFIIAAVLVAGRDNRGPEIMIPSVLSYKDGQDLSVLLNGVTAMDDRDGDVSNTLVVESLIVLGDGDKAKVTYIARDSSNNVSHVDAIISYSGDGNNIYSTFSGADKGEDNPVTGTEAATKEQATKPTTEPETQKNTTEDKNTAEETGGEKTDNENTDDEMTSEEDASAGAAEEKETSKAAATEEETTKSVAPVLKLVQGETTINKGEEFKVFKFVESITDDKEDRKSVV